MTEFDTQDVELLNEAVKNRQRFPRACLEAYNRLSTAGDNTTERIFLDHGGVSAWAAYIITKLATESTGHGTGKAKRQHLLRRIDAMTSETRQQLAIRVAATIPENERIEQSLKKASQRPKRIRRPRSIAAHEAFEGDSDAEAEDTQNSQTEALSSVAREGLSGIEQVFRKASITECGRLFPPYIAASIKRKPNPGSSQPFAAITMFTWVGNSECKLMLEITNTKIEFIARELFGIHMETEMESRYVFLLGTSTRILPYPSLMLKGCRITAAYEILGPEIAGAIFATQTHQLEVSEGRECTDCITMVVRQAFSDTADIHLRLPEEQGALVRRRLYSNMLDADKESRDSY